MKGDLQVQKVVRGSDEAMLGLGMPHKRSLKFLQVGVWGLAGAGGRRCQVWKVLPEDMQVLE